MLLFCLCAVMGSGEDGVAHQPLAVCAKPSGHVGTALTPAEKHVPAEAGASKTEGVSETRSTCQPRLGRPRRRVCLAAGLGALLSPRVRLALPGEAAKVVPMSSDATLDVHAACDWTLKVPGLAEARDAVEQLICCGCPHAVHRGFGGCDRLVHYNYETEEITMCDSRQELDNDRVCQCCCKACDAAN